MHSLPDQHHGPVRDERDAPDDPAPTRASALGRMVGLDVARALAVFGMYTVHIGPPLSATSGVPSWIRYLVDGRSSILFATLAGFSLMLIAGRLEPKVGAEGRRARARIAIRAVVLLIVGSIMAVFYGDVVILAFYGVYFLLAIPLTRLSAKTLALIALGLAVTTPQIAYLLKTMLSEPVTQAINSFDPLKKVSGVGILDLLLTGLYPTITWMTFVVAGMALARLDLSLSSVRARLATLGAIMALLGYGVARLIGGADALRSTAESSAPTSMAGASSKHAAALATPIPKPDLRSLLSAGPHSGTTFDIIGSLGFAIVVIVAVISAFEAFSWLHRVAVPLIAVGSMSLTCYVGHFVAQSMFGMGASPDGQSSWVPLLLFIIGAMLFATVWSRFFRRGPLEYLLNLATRPAQRIR